MPVSRCASPDHSPRQLRIGRRSRQAGEVASGGVVSRGVALGASASEYLALCGSRQDLSKRGVGGVGRVVASRGVGLRQSAFAYRTFPKSTLSGVFDRLKRAAVANKFARIAQRFALRTIGTGMSGNNVQLRQVSRRRAALNS